MGKYQAYNIVLDPGGRDPQSVAEELAAALPDAYESAESVSVAVEDILSDRTPMVWIEDGYVYHATGRNFDIHHPFGWDDVVPQLPVPARWAVATWQQEVESAGGVKVYAWADGTYRLIESNSGLYGTYGSDVAEDVRRTYGTEARAGYPIDPSSSHGIVESGSTADPESVSGFELVSSSSVRRLDAVRHDLTAESATARRRAANELYVLATQRDELDGIVPEVHSAWDDPVVRSPLTAALAELPITEGDLRRALGSENAPTRRAAARYCVVAGSELAPDAAVRDALTDDDLETRTLMARAVERAGVPRDHAPSEAFVAPLVSLATDSSPELRAAAALAVLRIGCSGSGETRAPSSEAVAAACDCFARMAFDDSAVVRDRLVAHLKSAYGPDEYWAAMSDALVDRLPGSIAAVDAESDSEPLPVVDDFLGYVAEWEAEYFEAPADELVVHGWETGSERARETVLSWVEEGEADRQEFVRSVAARNGVELRGAFS